MKKVNNKPQRDGKEAEAAVRALLVINGRAVEQKGYHDRFDLLVDGKWRCEVKIANPTIKRWNRADRPYQYTSWAVNFHRNGVLKEDYDFYLIRLEGVPGFTNAVHLLLPCPQGIKTKTFTLRSLIQEAAPWIENFRKLRDGLYERPPAQ